MQGISHVRRYISGYAPEQRKTLSGRGSRCARDSNLQGCANQTRATRSKFYWYSVLCVIVFRQNWFFNYETRDLLQLSQSIIYRFPDTSRWFRGEKMNLVSCLIASLLDHLKCHSKSSYENESDDMESTIRLGCTVASYILRSTMLKSTRLYCYNDLMSRSCVEDKERGKERWMAKG